jgi:hypothetical protein
LLLLQKKQKINKVGCLWSDARRGKKGKQNVGFIVYSHHINGGPIGFSNQTEVHFIWFQI